MVNVNTDIIDTVITSLITAFTALFTTLFDVILNLISNFLGGDLTANTPALLALVFVMLTTGGIMAWKISGVYT